MEGSFIDVDSEIIGTPNSSIIHTILDTTSVARNGEEALPVDTPKWMKSTEAFIPGEVNNYINCICPDQDP
jgi:hypothetical protein